MEAFGVAVSTKDGIEEWENVIGIEFNPYSMYLTTKKGDNITTLVAYNHDHWKSIKKLVKNEDSE